MDISKKLFDMQDLNYKNFHQKLMPTVDANSVIGVRTPQLRKFAKEFAKTEDAQSFIKNLPHDYYEENNLHAFVLEQIKDFDTAIAETERFLPYIDNWATCDMFLPPVFKKNKDKLILKIKQWILSDKIYTKRYAVKLLISLYLGEDFKLEYADMVADIKADEYYVKMVVAWYFATALDKNYDDAIGYITSNCLDEWTHNKAIQKAVESRRISEETKKYLKTLKR